MRAREAFDLAIALANTAAEAAGIRRHIDRPKGGVARMKRVISPARGVAEEAGHGEGEAPRQAKGLPDIVTIKWCSVGH
jgi:hypothetical protein